MSWHAGWNAPAFLVLRGCVTMPPQSLRHAVCWGKNTIIFFGVTISEVAI